MAVWNQVDVDFGGNETLCFGPRLETGTALYQLETNATVSPLGHVLAQPVVSACTANETVIVSSDRQLIVFSDSCRKFGVTLDFESQIDALGCTEDGHFVVVGEHDGFVHIFDCIQKRKLFSRQLEKKITTEPTFKEILLQQAPTASEGDQMLVLTATGQVHVFTKLLFNSFSHALSSNDALSLKTLQAQMTYTVFDASIIHSGSVNWGIFLNDSESVITVGLGPDTIICLWKREDEKYTAQNEAMALYGEGAVKCSLSTCGDVLVVLDNHNQLGLWSVDHLVILKRWIEAQVKDFVGLTIKEKSALLLLVSDPDNLCQVQIVTLPGMDCVYSVQLESLTTLAYCRSFQETFFLVEGIKAEKSPNKIDSLRVRSLTEAQPESRLMRMLEKKKFIEAEEFARLYDLDVQLVAKAKVNHLFNSLSSWNSNDLDAEATLSLLEDLKSQLVAIDDLNFVVDRCICSSLPRFAMMEEILCVAKNRIVSNKIPSQDVKRFISRTTSAIHLLSTFQILFGETLYTPEKWEVFQKSNMADILTSMLSFGNIQTALLLWNRHLKDFEHNLTIEHMHRFLGVIPDETSSADVRTWLGEAIVPYVVLNRPELLEFVASWMEQRIKSLEMFEKKGWPRNGLKLCEVLSNRNRQSLFGSGDEACILPDAQAALICRLSYIPRNNSNNNCAKEGSSALCRLHTLAFQLSALCKLYEIYNCRLLLAQYQRETVESVTYRLLDKVVAVELIPAAINDVLVPYMREHNLDEDRMLFQYIGDLAERCSKVVSCIGDAPWEAKAIQVIKCIKNLDYKCQAVLRAMSNAHIPWTPDMQSLVDEAIASNHSRVGEIKEQCRLTEFKKLLISYSLRQYNISETDQAEDLVYYILNHDRESAMDDALRVVAFYDHLDEMDALLFRAQFLIEKDRLDECLMLVRRLERNKGLKLAKQILSFTRIHLDARFQSSESKRLYARGACEVAKIVLRKLDCDLLERGEFEKYLKTMENVSYLQEKSGLDISLTVYENEESRHEILRKNLETFVGEKKNKKDKSALSRMSRLVGVLGVSAKQLYHELAKNALAAGDASSALSHATELCTNSVPDSETGLLLTRIAVSICELAGKKDGIDPAIATELYRLVCLALTLVTRDLLPNCIQLCGLLRLGNSTLEECSSAGDYGSAATVGQNDYDTFMKAIFESVYFEEGIDMDSSVVLPQVFQVVAASFESDGEVRDAFRPDAQIQREGEVKREKLQSLVESVNTLSGVLRENAQNELALAYYIQLLSILVQSKTTPSNQEEASGEALAKVAGLAKILVDISMLSLNKIFNRSRPDVELALAYVCNAPTNEALDCLVKMVKGAGFHYKRVWSIAQVGLAFTQWKKITAVAQTMCRELVDSSDWGTHLAKKKISFKHAFAGKENERMKLVQVLAQTESITLAEIRSYCSTFKIEEAAALLACVQYLMAPSSDQSDLVKESLYSVVPLAPEKAIRRAGIICGLIESKESLVEVLGGILIKLDPTDYERIGFVLDQLLVLMPSASLQRSRELLGFLKGYKSIVQPSEAEGRLSYPALVSAEKWKVVSPELNAETVNAWVSVCPILSLHPDQVYSTAIHNIILSLVKKDQVVSSKTAVRKPMEFRTERLIDKETFAVIGQLLPNISEPKLAVGVAAWIVKELPTGADKVLALKFCVELCERWLKSSPEGSTVRLEAHELWTNHHLLHRILATEQVLGDHRLATAEYIVLANSPSKLLFAMYEHPSVQTLGIPTEPVCEVHSAAEKIAAINGLKLKKIHVALLKKWLPSSAKSRQELADMTMTSTMNPVALFDVNSQLDDEDEVNLRRALYILSYEPPQSAAEYLTNIAFDSDMTKSLPMCHIRALRCLFSLADVGLISKLSPSKTISGIQYEATVLLFLSELDQFNVAETVESFSKLNKEGLIRSIWKNHNFDRRAVMIAAALGIRYHLCDDQLWSCILKQLMNFRMFRQLSGIFRRISGIQSIWSLPFVQPILCSFVSQALSSMSSPATGVDLVESLQLYSLLLCCPENPKPAQVLDWVHQFQRLELPACALGCILRSSPDESFETDLAGLLSPDSARTILSQLKDFSQEGHHLPLRGSIYDKVDGVVHGNDRQTSPTEGRESTFMVPTEDFPSQSVCNSFVFNDQYADDSIVSNSQYYSME